MNAYPFIIKLISIVGRSQDLFLLRGWSMSCFPEAPYKTVDRGLERGEGKREGEGVFVPEDK